MEGCCSGCCFTVCSCLLPVSQQTACTEQQSHCSNWIKLKKGPWGLSGKLGVGHCLALMKCPAPGETCISFRRVGPGWAPIVPGSTCDRYPLQVLCPACRLGWGQAVSVLVCTPPPACHYQLCPDGQFPICVTGAQLGPEPLCLAVTGQPQLQTWPWGFEDGKQAPPQKAI